MNDLFEKQLKGLVDSIVAGHQQFYHEKSGDSGPLPNRTKIINIIGSFREVLFPEYFGKQNLRSTAMDYYVGNLMVDIFRKLQEQVACALRHRVAKPGQLDEDIETRTMSICGEFLSKVPGVMEILATDIQAAFDGDPAAEDKDEIIFSYPGVFALFVYRLAHELYLLKVPLIPRIMTEYAHSRTGIDIHAGAKIGKYFFMDHGTGVVIGETTIIGDYVTIYQGVTVGALSTRGGQQLKGVKRHPTIEDNVIIYSGASILGGNTVIGRDVVIGSNVFITQSIPRGTRVSLRNQELLYQDRSHQDFTQDFRD
jgi:serine O-acetyltransferase